MTAVIERRSWCGAGAPAELRDEPGELEVLGARPARMRGPLARSENDGVADFEEHGRLRGPHVRELAEAERDFLRVAQGRLER